jgi:predicted methyltransferase MtxX (methanogen marker protein 4)
MVSLEGHSDIVVVSSDLAILFRSLKVNKVLIHGLVERDHDGSVRFETHGSSVIIDLYDFVTLQGHNLIALGKDLNLSFCFVSTDDFSTVSLQISS